MNAGYANAKVDRDQSQLESVASRLESSVGDVNDAPGQEVARQCEPVARYRIFAHCGICAIPLCSRAMNVWDRYVRALHTSDLRGSDVDETHLDLVHASGKAQQRHGGLAATLYRAQANPGSSENLERARGALLAFTLAAMRHQGKDPDAKVASRTADRICYDLLKPRCRTCHGVRYVAIPGTGRLSDIPCPSCNATGELRTPRDDELTGAVRTSVSRKVDYFARSMATKLRA